MPRKKSTAFTQRQRDRDREQEEIRKRLGTSTDDAVILAWHKRDAAPRRQTPKRLEPGRAMGGRMGM